MKPYLKILLPGILLAALLLAAVSPVLAASGHSQAGDSKIIFGDNYRLSAGETLDGDLVVLGGNVEVEESALIKGTIFLAGGNLNVAGEVQGDAIVLGGNLTLGDTALVTGDINSIGGRIDQAPDARVLGQTITNERPLDLVLPHSVAQPRYSVDLGPLGKMIGWFFQALALAALAILVVLLAPNGSNRTALAAAREPVAAGGIGLLTIVLLPAVLVLLVITIIGIPVALIVVLAAVVAGVFGWISLGLELGRRMARMLNVRWSLPLAAGLGAFTLSLVANGIGFIACVGWLAPFLVTCLGLGAVFLTRLGTQPYPTGLSIAPVSAYEPANPRPSAPPSGAVQMYDDPTRGPGSPDQPAT